MFVRGASRFANAVLCATLPLLSPLFSDRTWQGGSTHILSAFIFAKIHEIPGGPTSNVYNIFPHTIIADNAAAMPLSAPDL